jgi:hypothetical protein
VRSGILRTYVSTLRLRADAPWPSQLFELDSDGRRWRYIFKGLRLLSKTPSATRMVAWGKMPKVPH